MHNTHEARARAAPGMLAAAVPTRSLSPEAAAESVAHETTASFEPMPTWFSALRALRAGVAVADTGSVARAGQTLHLSASAITRAVTHLEHLAGVPLFNRWARGMSPTPAGSQWAHRARQILAHLDDGWRSAAACSPTHRAANANPRGALAASAAGLKALLAIAACPSETAAARMLSLSQTTVHRALKQLHTRTGFDLWLSSPRGTWLTPAGHALVRHLKLALAEARAIDSDLAAWRGSLRGRVVIGVLPLSVTQVLPPAISSLQHHHPEVTVQVVDGTYQSLLAQLRSAEVDVIVGALRATPSHDDVIQQVLFEDSLVIVARASHPCFDHDGLTMADLHAYPWVTPLQNTPAAQALDALFASQTLPAPNRCLQANNSALTLALVLASDRLALTSRDQAQQWEATGALRRVPVSTGATTRHVGTLTRRAGTPTPELTALVQALTEAADPLKLRHA